MTSRQAQRGSVLILTLWLATGLAAGALLLGHVAVVRYRRDANQRAALAAEHALDAGCGYVVQVLTTLAKAGALPDEEDYTAEDIAVGDCRLWLLGWSSESDATSPTYGLQDEAAKLNPSFATLAMLEAMPGMTAELAAAIVDWRDSDEEVTTNGAESDTYLACDPPYNAKNGPFETVDEIRLLNGADALLLNGVDRNRNSLVESWEKQLADESRERFQDIPDHGLLNLFTVTSREPNQTSAGQARTVLSQQNRANVLQTLQRLSSGGGSTPTPGAGSSPAPGAGPSPTPPPNPDTLDFSSVLGFCLSAKIGAEMAPTLFDAFMEEGPGGLNGRININTASAEVLACVPGIGEDNAEQVVAYRDKNPEALTSPLWLASALGDEAARKAGPYVTTKSYQVTADLVAVGPDGRTFRRARVTYDLTSGTPVLIAHRDLTHLGWPLGEALHRALVTSQGERSP